MFWTPDKCSKVRSCRSFSQVNLRFVSNRYLLWVFLFSLEEKLSHLKNENHVLRQKTLSISPERIGRTLGEVCDLLLFSAALFVICMYESIHSVAGYLNLLNRALLTNCHPVLFVLYFLPTAHYYSLLNRNTLVLLYQLRLTGHLFS